MKLNGWGCTDTGRKRDHNEDSFLIDDECGLFAVADGMGGHRGGATASRMAMEVMRRHVAAAVANLSEAAAAIESDLRLPFENTEVFHSHELDTVPPGHRRRRHPRGPTEPIVPEGTEPTMEFAPPPAITVMRAAVEEASFAIFEAALADPNLRGMGTTLTAMLYDQGRVYLVHAGDSRAYLFRNGKLKQITEDHSWIAEQMKSGKMSEEEAKASKYRHVITRSVGFEREVEVDTCGLAVQAGDCLLLCSDGMSNHLDHQDVEGVLSTTRIRHAPQRLIDLANERGGEDNITVVVVHVARHAAEHDDDDDDDDDDDASAEPAADPR
jgi:serine/threonine protein phosphatase PrpC